MLHGVLWDSAHCAAGRGKVEQGSACRLLQLWSHPVGSRCRFRKSAAGLTDLDYVPPAWDGTCSNASC